MDAGKNHVKQILRKKFWRFSTDRYFKGFHDDWKKNVSEYKHGKLVSYSSKNVSISNELKISRIIEIKYHFYFEAYFIVFDLFHAILLSAFNRIIVSVLLLHFQNKKQFLDHFPVMIALL